MEIRNSLEGHKFNSPQFTIILIATLLLPFAGSALDLVSTPNTAFTPPASAGGDSYNQIISADGRYVAFNSSANNLAHRSNGAPYLLPRPLKMNVFLRDRLQGTTSLISVDPTDTTGSEDDFIPTGISTNGQFVLFEGVSSNLVTDDPAHRSKSTEVYLRDVVNKTTTLVSARISFAAMAGCFESTMTPDARYVAFESSDTNLVSGPTNGVFRNIFVRDTVLGQTRLASIGISNANLFFAPEITPDGKRVAFIGENLFSANVTQDVYVCDLGTTNAFCVSSNSHQYFSGVPSCYGEKISADGKYVAYQANIINLPTTTAFVFRHNNQTGTDEVVSSNSVPAFPAQPFDMSPDGRFIAFIGKTNSGTSVFLWDGQTATTSVVSVYGPVPSPPPISCESPSVDATGRFVTFVGACNFFVANAVGNLVPHIYRRDMQSFAMELVDVGLDGSATNRNLNTDFSMSADGRYVAFDSPDADLVAQDANNSSDIFVRDLTAETTELASVADSSLPSQTSGRGDKRSGIHVSADGRFATFIAGGADLVPGYTNRFRNLFVRDLVNQSNFVASVDTNGLANADASTTESVISGDGRYVAFSSLADNLVPHDTNHASDVFLRDLQTGTTILVSTNGSGPGSPNGASFSPSIGLDGRYITYLSTAKNIVPLPAGSITNLFVYDRTLRTNYVLTTNSAPTAATTPDGRYVAFWGAVQASGTPNVYVWDSQLAQRVFTNTSSSGAISSMAVSTNGQWLAFILTSGSSASLKIVDRLTRSNITVSAGPFGTRVTPHFSGDGRYLAYATSAANIYPEQNGKQDIYLFDVQTRINVLVSRSYVTDNSPAGTSESPDISADGRYIIYQSDAADIVPSDNNHQKDVFLFDQQSGSTLLLSAGIYGAGTGNFESQTPHFTGDGQTVTFQSWASDLAPNDFNQGGDLFLLKIINPIGSTNPPPVFAGQIILGPGPLGILPGQTPPQLTWPATPGAGYRVEYKTDLTDEAWVPVIGRVAIENGQGYVTDLYPDPHHRFYRIVAQ